MQSHQMHHHLLFIART